MSRLEHSELLLGPFENLTNSELDPLARAVAMARARAVGVEMAVVRAVAGEWR